MSKKILAIIFVLSLLLTFVSCKDEDVTSKDHMIVNAPPITPGGPVVDPEFSLDDAIPIAPTIKGAQKSLK